MEGLLDYGSSGDEQDETQPQTQEIPSSDSDTQPAASPPASQISLPSALEMLGEGIEPAGAAQARPAIVMTVPRPPPAANNTTKPKAVSAATTASGKGMLVPAHVKKGRANISTEDVQSWTTDAAAGKKRKAQPEARACLIMGRKKNRKNRQNQRRQVAEDEVQPSSVTQASPASPEATEQQHLQQQNDQLRQRNAEQEEELRQLRQRGAEQEREIAERKRATAEREREIEQLKSRVLDSWDFSEEASSAPYNEALKASLIDAYSNVRRMDGHKQLVFCMLLQQLPISTITAARLFPRRSHSTAHRLGIEDIDDVRNGLLLFKPLKRAFHHSQLCFIWDCEWGHCVAYVLDGTLWNEILVDTLPTNTPEESAIKTLWPPGWVTRHSATSRVARTSSTNKLNPFERVLEYHAKQALLRARYRRWTRPQGSLPLPAIQDVTSPGGWRSRITLLFR
ncbi:hypothetical protein JKP88DRAFT_332340 [Tribonema minus]|uniref:HNH nuclease domain-containing protein n=1 Tax=Tribonema minus TaxID=303371 RepID=A0A835YKY4_9STRA|nr:hypothetical protein JKP88DRAFT_332340 [Tribonema minus]